MKNLDDLIGGQYGGARYFSQNGSYVYDPTTGIYTSGLSTEVFIEAANSAQDHLQAKIVSQGSELFLTDEDVSLVANQASYTLAKRVFAQTAFKNVYYNRNGSSDPDGWGAPFKKGIPRDRRFTTGEPRFYVAMAGKVTVGPIPDTSVGTLRVCFVEELDDLDIKRAKVSGTPVNKVITLAAASPTPDAYRITNADFICISDADGNVMLRNGEVASYSSGTPSVTLVNNVSTYLTTGYSLSDLAGGFVTVGKNTTILSKLPDICETYLQTYMQKRAMTGNSDSGSLEEDTELVKIEGRILSFYGNETPDNDEIPILDEEIMD